MSLLTFGITFASRHYSASLHNVVVNRHRQNALGSFQALASGAVDKEIKDAILLQATQAIYAPQSSGYVRGTSESRPMPGVVEIFRNVGKATTKRDSPLAE